MAHGTSLGFMQDLVAHWRDRHDWRATETALNAWPQFRTRIDGIDIHFLRAGARRCAAGGRCCCRTAGRDRCSSL